MGRPIQRPQRLASVLCVAAPILGARIGFAQPDGPTVQAWFDQAWAEARTFPKLSGIMVSWTTEIHETLPADQMERLRLKVGDHPEHPERPMLEMYERHAAGMPDVQQFRLWAMGTLNWRVSLDFSVPGTAESLYWDKTVTPGHAWMLLPDSLAIIRPADGYPQDKDLPAEERAFLPILGAFLTNGLSSAWLGSLQPSPVKIVGEKWTVEFRLVAATGDVIFRSEYGGRWDDSIARGFTESVRVVSSEGRPDTVGEVHRISGYRMDDVLGDWVATRIEERTADGRLVRVHQFGEAEPFTGSFAELTAIPSAGGSDPIRGASTFTRIHDYRSGLMTVASGAVEERGPIPGYQPRPNRDWKRTAGWIAAGSLIVGLGGLALRRRMR